MMRRMRMMRKNGITENGKKQNGKGRVVAGRAQLFRNAEILLDEIAEPERFSSSEDGRLKTYQCLADTIQALRVQNGKHMDMGK